MSIFHSIEAAGASSYPLPSFLAILCGDNGEKVELFAGTYRTALGLSRTFILPDSPRSLELQLQGDDLVEVFLVFSQNVFGLEPATVRVREVRIGRAERRAARRRARENMSGRTADGDTDGGAANGEEDASVSVTIGVAVTPPATDEPPTPGPGLASPPSETTSQVQLETASTTAASADELVAVAAAQASPYTTFQQLSFAPNFPLAAIADEYIIPPTYRSFLEYRSQYEPEVNGGTNVDLSQVQFSPPGLPVPTPAPPCKWFYRDPKGVVHGMCLCVSLVHTCSQTSCRSLEGITYASMVPRRLVASRSAGQKRRGHRIHCAEGPAVTMRRPHPSLPFITPTACPLRTSDCPRRNETLASTTIPFDAA